MKFWSIYSLPSAKIGPWFMLISIFTSCHIFGQLSFTESAASWGINLGNQKDGGHAFGDYDGDGDLDLIVNTNNSTQKTRLYRNNGNSTFTDVTAVLAPDLLLYVRERSVVWGDVNNDGHLDFMRNTFYDNTNGRPLEIFIQDPATGIFGNGSGGTTPFKIGNSGTDDLLIGNHNMEGIGFFDLEGDGDLDIVIDNHNFGTDILRNNYVDHTTMTVVNPPFANLFSFATPGTGTVLGIPQSATDGDFSTVSDIDDDGWVDILVRKNGQTDLFYNSGGTFINPTELDQTANSNKGAIATYDYDNDGDFDLFWTEASSNQIFRNDGGGTWTGLGSGGTTGIPTSFSGNPIDEVASGDIDNDGDVDILLVGDNRSYLYLNLLNDPVLGKNTGSPMTFSLYAGSSFNTGDGESTSMVDIDKDGDLDIYMVINNSSNQLWINNLYSGATPASMKDYLFVEVWDERSEYIQSGSERAAFGATVILEDCVGNVVSGIRDVNGGTGHGREDPYLVHFGITDGNDFDYRITVRYPNYINTSGDTIRTEIVKYIRPSDEAGTPIIAEIRTNDNSLYCPCERVFTINPQVHYLKKN